MLTPPSRRVSRRLTFGFIVALGAGATLAAQIPSRNVNMVAGTEWPGGDPFLQRQNEPSIAASTRNPLHLVGGSNDYRTVDLPGLPGGTETGDAWLSVYKSFDGGQRWSSTLIPGYPQDTSPAGTTSPIKGYQAAADPVVRAGTNGLIYYNGLAFDRTDDGRSAIFLSRFIDRNNKENGDPIAYLGTSVVASTSGAAFFDKPWIAIDIPRGSNPPLCVVGGTANGANVKRNGHRNLGAGNGKGNQVPDDGLDRVPAGAVYVAYTSITGADATLRSEIFLKRSVDCGATWSAPIRVSRTADAVNQGASIAINPVNGNVEVAWRRFANAAAPDADAIMVARLPVGAGVFDPPGVARGLHRTGTKLQDLDELFEHRKRGVHTAEAADIAEMDQNTTEFRFRTNAYPTMAIDGTGRVYVAWAERGFGLARPDVVDGDSRILVATASDGLTFGTPRVVDDGGGQGHQLMPTLAFAGGKLMLVFYDLRETKARVFERFVSDTGLIYGSRQTIDIRASLGTPGAAPSFTASVRVSDYLTGARTELGPVEQLQVNPPNLPMFKLGTVPFLGDYIDVAPSPAFVPAANGSWTFNTATTATAPVFHTAWTDNRDVRPPRDGNWQNYTPPTLLGGSSASLFDPSKTVPACQAGNAGSRNQNVYTAKIGGGLLVGAPGNTKPLSTTLPRGFVVFAQNRTTLTKTFRMKVLAQPAGGRASFSQFPLPPYGNTSPAPLTSLDVQVPPLSTASRTLYVTATDPQAQVNVDVSEVSAVGGTTVTGGLTGSVLLNPDIANPDIANPDIANPDIANPDIANAEVYNPDIANPDIANPDIANPDIANPDIANPDIANVVVANPDIANPDIANPDIANPDIANPDIANPDIANPDIANGAISDVSWTVTNTGNTTSAFNVNLFLANTTLPSGLKTQLILYKTYQTPVLALNGCDLRVETRNQLLSNIIRPTFVAPGQTVPDQNSPTASNATLWLAPGEVARITLRVFDNDRSNNIIVTNLDGSTASIDPALNPATTLTAGIAAQGVDVGPGALDPPGATKPPIVTTTGTNLFYLQQPTSAAPGAPIAPPVRVRVWSNAGLPLPGVSVSMSLVNPPPGVALGGTTSAVSDSDGIATFSALTVNVAATGLTLRASATSPGVIAAGTSAPFTVGVPGGWAATGTGTVTTVDSGATNQPVMQYYVNPAFAGDWRFATTATSAGTIPMSYVWDGFHSYFMVNASLDVFVNRGGIDVSLVNLVSPPTTSCDPCRPPSGGFTYSGTTSVTVLPGDIYGFKLSGSHSDGTQTLQGTLSVGISGAPVLGAAAPASIAAGQMIVLRGHDMPATGAAGILFNQGGADTAATFLFYSAPDPTNEFVIARSPATLVPGPATVRSASATSTTRPLPITITDPTLAPPSSPPLLRILGGSCSATTDLTSITPGQTVSVLADGVDTSGTTFLWRNFDNSVTLPTTPTFTTAGTGSICTVGNAPTAAAGFTSGQWHLEITTTVGGNTSSNSGAKFFIVP